MPDLPPIPRGGATAVAVTWAVAGVLHVVIGLGSAGPVAALAFTLAAVAFVGAAALLVTPRGELLIAAGVAGTVGVATFALPLILPLLGVGDPVPDPTEPWRIGGFLIDRADRPTRDLHPASGEPGTSLTACGWPGAGPFCAVAAMSSPPTAAPAAATRLLITLTLASLLLTGRVRARWRVPAPR